MTSAQIHEIIEAFENQWCQIEGICDRAFDTFREPIEELLEAHSIGDSIQQDILQEIDGILYDIFRPAIDERPIAELGQRLLQHFKPYSHEILDVLERDFKPGTSYRGFESFNEALFQNFGEKIVGGYYKHTTYLAENIIIDDLFLEDYGTLYNFENVPQAPDWDDPEWLRSEKADVIISMMGHCDEKCRFIVVTDKQQLGPVICLGLYELDLEKSISYNNESNSAKSDNFYGVLRRIGKDSEPTHKTLDWRSRLQQEQKKVLPRYRRLRYRRFLRSYRPRLTRHLQDSLQWVCPKKA